MRSSLLLTTLAALLAALALAVPAAAAPTDLDSLFDGDGLLVDTANIADRGVVDTEIDPNGKIVTLTSTNAGINGTDIRVNRRNSDGTPDMGFDGDGLKIIDVDGDYDHGNELYIYPDGSILIAANVRITTGTDFGLIKLESDGDLDPAFGGGDGWVSTPVGYDNASYGNSLDVQSNGQIIVGGEADGNDTATSDGDFAVARYNANGTIDTTFGFDDPNDAGSLKTGWSVQSLEPYPNEKIVKIWAQSDGKILAAGQTQVGLDVFFALARFQSTGFIDTTFAVNGHRTVPAITNYADIPADAVMQADGKIVIVGETLWDPIIGGGRSDKDFGIARLNADGSMDTTFWGDGTVGMDFGLNDDFANAVTVDECGRILVAGQTGDGTYATLSDPDDFALARFQPSGSLDSTFGTGGSFTQSIGSVEDFAESIAVQPSDNKIVLAGASYNSTPITGYKTVIERMTGGGACVEAVPQGPPAPAPEAPPADAPAEAEALIGSPGDGDTVRRRLLKISGTATGSGSEVVKVELAMRREKKGRCVWLKSSSGGVRNSKPRSGECTKSTWLKAPGTNDWSYHFKRKPRRGTYRLYAARSSPTARRSPTSRPANSVKFKIR